MRMLVVKRLISRVFSGEVGINLEGIFKDTDDGFMVLLIPHIIFFHNEDENNCQIVQCFDCQVYFLSEWLLFIFFYHLHFEVIL